MSKTNNSAQSLQFTRSEEVSLPANEPPGVFVPGRDWKKLGYEANLLSNATNNWETTFTISVSVFVSFLISFLGDTGNMVGLKGLYLIITAISLAVSVTSFFASKSEKNKFQVDKAALSNHINEIQSLFNSPTDSVVFDTEQINDENVTTEQILDAQDSDTKLYKEAVDIALEKGKISTSLLQRRLRIGYSRAARIIDEMERRGAISEFDGVGAREVLLGKNDVK